MQSTTERNQVDRGITPVQGQSYFSTLSLENHQDGVYLHRHGVTLSLQAILVCSDLPV